MKILITGSSGLVGSEAVETFSALGWQVFGVDNNMRALFFGEQGDTLWNLRRLKGRLKDFTHFDFDIRNREAIFELFQQHRFHTVIHCAAQPSHDKAREIPLVDFEVNALGTANLLEATRLFCPESVFILMSTNKVYGDAPNELPLSELETRYEYARPEDFYGISESCRIDRSYHSLFGASKAAGDILAQEYGRTFGLKIGIFRGGCITGPSHSGVELHGFFSYLVKVALKNEKYTIYGYKGKQVRDQIHSRDLIRAMQAFAQKPRPGEVYNMGGGRENSASFVVCIALIEKRIGRKILTVYKDENRKGDHICYISDLRKFKNHYPEWSLTRTLDSIVDELIKAESLKAKS